MANEPPPERSGLAEPVDVQVTVMPRRQRAAAHRGTQARLMFALLIAAAVVGVVALRDTGGGRSAGTDATARLGGPAGVAAAYGHPLRCLSVTIAADRTFARADFNHASPCGRYDGYVTAIFHRVDGVWRGILDANGYSCPVSSIPSGVQTELGVCP